MKHIFIPLIGNGKFVIDNIPRIGSTENHVDLIRFLGVKTKWLSKNKFEIKSTNDIKNNTIPKKFVYYTSGGNHIIPIIASKYGSCEVETVTERSDYGGDQIGSRKFQDVA